LGAIEVPIDDKDQKRRDAKVNSRRTGFNDWGPEYTINKDPKTASRSQGGVVVNTSASGIASNERTAAFMNKASEDPKSTPSKRLTAAKLQVKHMIGAALGRGKRDAKKQAKNPKKKK
jgi:hypothetical protein